MSEDTSNTHTTDGGQEVLSDGGWWDLFHQQEVTYDLLPPKSGRRSPGETFERALSTLNDRQSYIHEIDASERPDERLGERPESQSAEQEGRI